MHENSWMDGLYQILFIVPQLRSTSRGRAVLLLLVHSIQMYTGTTLWTLEKHSKTKTKMVGSLPSGQHYVSTDLDRLQLQTPIEDFFPSNNTLIDISSPMSATAVKCGASSVGTKVHFNKTI